jgi:hypothetical protein
MSKKDKLLARIRQSPKTVRFHEIEGILLGLGFDKRKSKHVVFSRGPYRLVIPEPHPEPFVHRAYVKNFLELMDALEHGEQ